MDVSWAIIKAFVIERATKLQYISDDGHYFLWAWDGAMGMKSSIRQSSPANTDQADFELNFKPTANARLQERATLKLVKMKAATVTGTATLEIKVPGTFGSGDGRLIEAGNGWFESAHPEDYVKISITDEDDLLGLGAGFEVDSYTDKEVPAINQGWYIPGVRGEVAVTNLAGMGFVPSALYIKITAIKGTGEGIFRANIKWGKRD